MHLQLLSALVLATSQFVSAQAATSTSSSILAVSSPAWLPDFPKPADVVAAYPTNLPNITATLSHASLNLSEYPEPWSSPKTDHPEIAAVMKALDWTKVPNAAIHTDDKNGDISFSGYDENKDPYCWWSDTNCVKPKATYLPEDVYECPKAGDWGQTFDDGPFNPSDEKALIPLNKWAEPELYNFLAQHNQKATLFYIGSNVVTFPAAARRALNDGHVICVHTWSHPQMTTQSNIKVVAEFYWTLRAIKQTLGITPKCWRPPYGDVDDRVRAIAWQMGLRTFLWDRDSNDWAMPGDGGGDLPPATVDGYFEGWIESRKNGTDTKTGHVVLEHELNNSTVEMAEKWLPKMQQTFNVITPHACMNITQPYWEDSFVYPTGNTAPAPSANATSNATAAASTTAASAKTTDAAPAGEASKTVPSELSQDSGKPTSAASSVTGSVSLAGLALAAALLLN
ncbi:hypothetical protein DFQ28_005954 [Apophysomyces sp. BC1034]|nr:hypothetical protein DFQ30_008302 [Apophysomyces sp. BC1015]KAG0181803.1 hypothetical protein DFQ29_007031 [Apophysomyces sp. BC1021]KAG0187697.1 hypothetical protein DFQ28_005954 [Apophysomyces sp. BC1034]